MSEVPSFYYLKRKKLACKKVEKNGDKMSVYLSPDFPDVNILYVVQLWNYKIMVAIL